MEGDSRLGDPVGGIVVAERLRAYQWHKWKGERFKGLIRVNTDRP